MSFYYVKVYPQGRAREAYRKFIVGGRVSFDELGYAILNAFEFEDTMHAYEFITSHGVLEIGNECYSENNIGNTALCLDDIGFIKGEKFIYHFDFGDDWMFVIHVSKVSDRPKETDDITGIMLLDSKGTVHQYPDDDFDENDDEY